MLSTMRLPLLDLTLCLSDALDLVSPALVGHHKRTAYISLQLANEAGMTGKDQSDAVMAALLHDIGVLEDSDALLDLRFEVGQETQRPYAHPEWGHYLLSGHDEYADVATIVKHHHTPWLRDANSSAEEAPMTAHLVHLADRVDVLHQVRENEGLSRRDIVSRISELAGQQFAPDLVKAFQKLASREYFWFDLEFCDQTTLIKDKLVSRTVDLNLDQLVGLGTLFCRLIDFRSRFTSTHSSGVAVCAEALACWSGLSQRQCGLMRLAGYLHDLGKLAVPPSILEKPGKLTEAEFEVMKSHTYHSYRILQRIPQLSTVNAWGAFHHERLNGSGYPFHLDSSELIFGARIMAVADVFTAITEDRPYRRGMEPDRALAVLTSMAKNESLDGRFVATVRDHYDELNTIRVAAQTAASLEFGRFEEATSEFPAGL